MRGLCALLFTAMSVACTSETEDGGTGGRSGDAGASPSQTNSSGSGGASGGSSAEVPRQPEPLPPLAPDALTAACDDRPRVGSWPLQEHLDPDVDPEPNAEHELSAGLFDPENVYVLGTPRAGLCNGGVGWVFDASALAYGAHCNMQVRMNPTSRRLVSLDGVPPRVIREMVGGSEPGNKEDDIDIPTPPECAELVQDYHVAPDGSVFVLCGGTWWRSDGIAVHTALDGYTSPARLGSDAIVHVGCRGYALLGNGILEMHSGQVTPLSQEFLADEIRGTQLLATRAAADGFWTAVYSDREGRTALWRLSFYGDASYVGEYQRDITSNHRFALGGDGALYSTVLLGSAVERRRLNRGSDVLLRAGDGLMAQIHSHPPITGP